ncbi:hypothetical protein SMICM304S_10085 [Streptomyces microflavus]
MRTSTSAATPTPMISVEPISGAPRMISPPCSTRSPSADAPAAVNNFRCASVTLSATESNCTWTRA